MPERLHPTSPSVGAVALHRLLAAERDPHERQRELVRISLVACPPTTGGRPPRRA